MLVAKGAEGYYLLNKFSQNERHDIVVDKANPVVEENYIEFGGSSGILCRNEAAGYFYNNFIRKKKLSGIEIEGNANPTIRKNRISGVDQTGVVIRKGGRGIIEGNEIRGNFFLWYRNLFRQ